MISNNKGEWSDADVQTLKEIFPTRGVSYCAEIFGRSKSAISKKTSALGIKHGRVSFHFLRENFEPIVKAAKNVTDICKKLGYKAAGGNHAQIKKYIQKYGLDTSHFSAFDDERRKNMHKPKLTSIEDVLIEGSTYSRTQLKKRLYDSGLKKRECELCGQGEEWQGKHMSLILDHVNGVNNDNRLPNLRIVCPNCNATLDTHGGKNNRKETKYTCPDCHGPMGRTSTWCQKCAKNHYNTSHRKYERPSLQQLLVDIKNLGYRGTGRKYGTNGPNISKWEKDALALEK